MTSTDVVTTAMPAADPSGSPDAALPPTRSRWERTKQWRPAKRAPRSTAVAVASSACLVFSLTAIWLLVYAVFFSGIQEHSQQHRLYASIRYSLAEELVPLGGSIKPGTPVAVLSAPTAGLTRAVVVEGTTSGLLREGPGHLQNTPLPGQAGVSVLMGKSETFGGPFGRVASMRPGDKITVTTGQGDFTYVVTDVRGNGDPLPPALASDAGRLTLVTSQGTGWRSGWAPNRPVFVDAALHGPVQPAPAGRPTTVPAAATVMHSDTGGLVSLVLWLQLLLIISVAVVWARVRWGSWQAWLAGAPAILAVVWLASSDALRLLPNLV